MSNRVHTLHVMQLQSQILHLNLGLEVTERPAPEVRLVKLVVSDARWRETHPVDTDETVLRTRCVRLALGVDSEGVDGPAGLSA